MWVENPGRVAAVAGGVQTARRVPGGGGLQAQSLPSPLLRARLCFLFPEEHKQLLPQAQLSTASHLAEGVIASGWGN